VQSVPSILPALNFKRRTFPAGRTLIMGVLNVTPDSFSDGGRYFDRQQAIEHARTMVAEGADILDIGGESTRPGAGPVSAEEELRRVLPVVETLAAEVDVPISVDTLKPEVADRCLAAGADIVNDVQGLREPAMMDAAARHRAAVIIMHMKGTPRTMTNEAIYADLIGEVSDFLTAQAESARTAGIETVIIDPGIGFAKNMHHNLMVLRHVDAFVALGYPVLIGPSRKRFIGDVTGRPADDRVAGTLAAVTAAVLGGAAIVRVHDVAPAKQAVQVAEAIRHP
jgi:dihydropteroate synthase